MAFGNLEEYIEFLSAWWDWSQAPALYADTEVDAFQCQKLGSINKIGHMLNWRDISTFEGDSDSFTITMCKGESLLNPDFEEVCKIRKVLDEAE